jgi:hypothetical protein
LELATFSSEMVDPIAKPTSMRSLRQSVLVVTNPYAVTASMLWDLSGTLNISHALIAKNPSLEEVSSNLQANHIVKFTTINKPVLSVPVVANRLLEDASMLWKRNGTLNILCVPSV